MPVVPAPTLKPPTSLRWLRYLLLIITVNSMIWGATGLYLKRAKPTYISEWALILPGSAPRTDINLPEIGQASSSSNSPFGGATTDPRANYQFIATSEAVITKAAALLDLPVQEFGEPRIKLIDNTTIMKFQISGKTPQQAQQKSQALYQALVQQLSLLRVEEVARRDDGIQSTLRSAREKLQIAQQNLSNYKVASGLSFPGQVDNLSVNVEQLRRQRAEMLAQQRQVTARSQQLSTSLGISSQQAASAFVLQADQQFQQNLKDYSDSTAQLGVLLSKWGENHPAVIKEKARQESAQAAIIDRSTQLLGRVVDLKALQTLQLGLNDQGSGRSSLFRDLIAVQAEQQGLATAVRTIDQQITLLDARLNGLAQGQSKLENLKREVQTAEAVFASTVAKLDLGKSDIFSAYPLVQMVAQPSLPTEASAPKKSLILLGGGLGSGFSTLGLILLWWRKRWLRSRGSKSVPALAIEPAQLGGDAIG